MARADLRPVVDLLHDRLIGREPDLTFVIDMEPQAALTRGLERNSGEDRFEDFGLPFQQKLRQGFLALAQQYSGRCHVIDGGNSTEAVASAVFSVFKDVYK